MKKLVIMGLAAAVAVAVQAETAFRLGDISQVVFEDAFATNSAKNWGAAAARDLRNALAKVTGRSIPYDREAKGRKLGGVTVYVGDTAAARAAGLDASKLRRGAFRLVTRPGQAFILSNTGMAATYGVAEFLQRYADYWFCLLSGDDPYTVAPEREVPCADLIREHDIYARHYYIWGKRYPKTCQTTGAEYSRRTRSRSWFELEPEEMPSRLPGYSHSYYKYVPPEQYWTTHPEYYSLAEDGLRHSKANCASELCLSNPDVLEIVFTNMCRMIAQERAEKGAEAPRIYDFSQMDNASYICLCDNCRKIIAKYNKVPGGHKEGGDAGLQLEFVNKLARKIKAVYPDVIIRTFAYVTTEEPPKGGIRPEDNVMMWLCDLYSTCDDMLPLEHPFNANRLRLVNEWRALSRHFEIWDYYLTCGDYPAVDAVAADIRYFRKIGLKRMYNETKYANQPFYELMRFVTSELYFDADKDLETLVATWCRVYGKGAVKMKTAIDFLRKLVLENPPKDTAAWHGRVLPFETPANLEKALALMKTAYDEEIPGTCRARIAQPMGALCKKLMTIYKTLGKDADFARMKTLYPKYALEALEASGMHANDVKAERRRIAEAVELADLVFTDLPDELKDVPEKDLKFIDYHHMQPGYKTTVLVTNNVPGGKGYRWAPLKEGDFKPPFNCSMLDEDLVYNHLHPFTPVADGQWHWYRIAVDRLGRSGWVGMPYIGDNSLAFKIHHLYVECDGLPADPNWYEMWVSVKWGGDVRDPVKGLFADRLILRRVPEPKAKNFNDLNAK